MQTRITVAFLILIFQIGIPQVELYNLRCPMQGNWKFRAKIYCNSTLKYFCLYNNAEGKYVEGCNGPDWDRKGSKREFSLSFTRGNCSQNRYQPFIFQTNGGMSDCVYAKSICNDEGQIIYQNNSTKKDTTCRCDYAKNYAFIKDPRNVCYCIPTEEDCSCSIRSCPGNYTLSTDYECIRSDNKKKQQCVDRNIHYETVEEKSHVKIKQNNILFHTRSEIKGRSEMVATVVICLCIALLIGDIVFVLVFYKSTSETIHTLEIYCQEKIPSTNETIHTLEVYCEEKVQGTLSRDDVNFLRMIHLLFRVACPVIRMKFNHEIQPNQLRKTLDDNRFKMETLYRKDEIIINDFQWGLLYSPVKGKTVKSEEFDIRLTIYLLCALAHIKIVSVYPDSFDTSDSAMLSRIKYIRNKATRRFEADLSEEMFEQYWNDIRQAVNTLVSKLDIKDDKESTQLIENLKVKSLQIPESCQLHQKAQTFTDLTTEENNFLIVFYVLTKIVYPLIKQVFNTKCTDWSMFGFEQRVSPQEKESKNFDLRWMIYILKRKALEDGNKDDFSQLDVIYDIQREMVQSSSGMLNEERFHDILKGTKEAVLHLGGEWNEEQIVRLQHTNVF